MNRVSKEFLCSSEHVVYEEREAKQNLFLWGCGLDFFLSFRGWWWVLLSADLNLGVFTGMFSGGLHTGIPTQTENELKQFSLFFLCFGL